MKHLRLLAPALLALFFPLPCYGDTPCCYGFGNPNPGAVVDIGLAGTTLGTFRLEGNTSGYVQLQTAAAAGSWTMTLPTGAGTSGYVLSTDGTGITSWVAAGGSTINLGTSASVTNPQRSGDATTGLFSPATSTVAVATGGTERVRINSSGNVGIGTTSPTYPLEVVSPNAGGMLKMRNSSTSGWVGTDLYDATSTQQGYVGWANSAQGSIPNSFQVGTSNNYPLILSTSGTERIRILGGGNVGIGTTAPAATLDVAGTLYSRRVALTDGATIAVDWSQSNIQSVTLGGNRTFTFSNPVDGARYILIIKQDATGSRTATWPATCRWPGGTAPTLTTTVSKTDYITFIYNGVDSKYDGVSISQNF